MSNDTGTYFQLRGGDIVMGYGAGRMMISQDLLVIGQHAIEGQVNAYDSVCLGNYACRYVTGLNSCVAIGQFSMYYGYHDPSITIGFGSFQYTNVDIANVTIVYRSEKYVNSYRNVIISANIGTGDSGDTLQDSIIIGELAVANGQTTVLSLGNVGSKNAMVKGLGPGDPATFGAVGGSGPATSGQNSWLHLIIGGSDFYILLWA